MRITRPMIATKPFQAPIDTAQKRVYTLLYRRLIHSVYRVNVRVVHLTTLANAPGILGQYRRQAQPVPTTCSGIIDFPCRRLPKVKWVLTRVRKPPVVHETLWNFCWSPFNKVSKREWMLIKAWTRSCWASASVCNVAEFCSIGAWASER